MMQSVSSLATKQRLEEMGFGIGVGKRYNRVRRSSGGWDRVRFRAQLGDLQEGKYNDLTK